MYYLYSIKMQGWVSVQSTYTSDITEAATFPESQALARCALGKTKYSLATIPVLVSLVESL